MSKNSGQIWHISQIEAVKKAVKTSLDDAMTQGGVSARLKKIFEEIHLLEDRASPEDHLRLVVCVISAFVHHERYGGVSSSQIERLTTLAYGVLRLHGVRSETSRVSVLYGELHLALCQIHRKHGRHWAASWEQHMAHYLSRVNPPGGAAFQALSLGLRAHRLGHMRRADSELLVAEQGPLEVSHLELARISRVRTLRLSARYDEAHVLITATLANPMTPRLASEVAWEKICLEAARQQDLAPMIKAVRKGGSHHSAVYMTEAYFWALCSHDSRWLERLPKMSTLGRNPKHEARSMGLFFEVAVKIEEIHNEDVPFVMRLKILGSLLENAATFSALDRELLLYLAATRWLARNRQYKLAATCLWEYKGSCLKLSDGVSSDVLGLAEDLLARPWFVAA